MVLSRRVGLAAALCLATLASGTFTPPAHAQEGVTARRKEAKSLADSGYDLMQKGLYAEAAELFRKADARFHSPMFVVFIAEAEEKLGHFLEARDLLRKVMNEPLEEYAPDSFRRAKKEAQKRLDALEARIPRITIELIGDGAEGARVTIDGKVTSVGSPVMVDPGQHAVAATTSDGRSADRTANIAEGESKSIEIDLGSSEGGVAIGGEGDIEPDPDEPDDGSTDWLLPGIAYGVGGVGLVIGVAVGAAFIGKAGDLKDSCPDDVCPPEKEADGDTVTTLGNVATVGWIVAGLGAAVGTILLLVQDDEPPANEAYRTRLFVGPTGAVVQGHF
jgi:hypothetical protein